MQQTYENNGEEGDDSLESKAFFRHNGKPNKFIP